MKNLRIHGNFVMKLNHLSVHQWFFLLLLLVYFSLILTSNVPFTDQRPRLELSKDQEVCVAAFNFFSENRRSFRVLVTTSNLLKYTFYYREASLLKNSHGTDTALDKRAHSTTSKLLLPFSFLFIYLFILFYKFLLFHVLIIFFLFQQTWVALPRLWTQCRTLLGHRGERGLMLPLSQLLL